MDRDLHLRQAMGEEMAEASPRAAAIVLAAWVEEALTDALARRLDLNQEDNFISDKIFSERGYLGTFASKVDMAFALGLMTDAIYRDMNIIRRIRNHFAHRITEKNEPARLTFETQSIRDSALALNCVKHEGGHPDAFAAYSRACIKLRFDFAGVAEFGGGMVFAVGIDK